MQVNEESDVVPRFNAVVQCVAKPVKRFYKFDVKIFNNSNLKKILSVLETVA